MAISKITPDTRSVGSLRNDPAGAPLGEKWGGRNTFGVSIASQISIDKISMRIGSNEVLRDISLNIEPGRVLSLLGPSGSGKTTLLRIIAGLELPTRGRISIDDRVMNDETSFVAPEQRGIGLVFQDYALFPHLSVLENIKFGLEGRKSGGSGQVNEQARRILSRVGLQRFENSYPYQLSGGEQQRVALARALAPRPGILLMDEPFSGLDARMRDTIREQTIELLRDTRSTVVIVTHDPEEALRVSDNIVLMQNGKIIQTGNCHEMYYSPNCHFAAEFFTELNTFRGIVKNGVLATPFGKLTAEGIAENMKAVACVRLSDITIETGKAKTSGTGKSQSVLAQVTKRRFMGIVELLELYIPGMDEPIKARIKAGILPQKLNMVSISTDLSAIMVFEDK